MNIRMYTAAREATTKARNVASAIQQVTRQVNDDNKDIMEKVDKNTQVRSKRKAELELAAALGAKKLAEKQAKISSKQAGLAMAQIVTSFAASRVGKGIDKESEDTPDAGEEVKDAPEKKEGFLASVGRVLAEAVGVNAIKDAFGKKDGDKDGDEGGGKGGVNTNENNETTIKPSEKEGKSIETEKTGLLETIANAIKKAIQPPQVKENESGRDDGGGDEDGSSDQKGNLLQRVGSAITASLRGEQSGDGSEGAAPGGLGDKIKSAVNDVLKNAGVTEDGQIPGEGTDEDKEKTLMGKITDAIGGVLKEDASKKVTGKGENNNVEGLAEGGDGEEITQPTTITGNTEKPSATGSEKAAPVTNQGATAQTAAERNGGEKGPLADFSRGPGLSSLRGLDKALVAFGIKKSDDPNQKPTGISEGSAIGDILKQIATLINELNKMTSTGGSKSRFGDFATKLNRVAFLLTEGTDEDLSGAGRFLRDLIGKPITALATAPLNAVGAGLQSLQNRANGNLADPERKAADELAETGNVSQSTQDGLRASLENRVRAKSSDKTTNEAGNLRPLTKEEAAQVQSGVDAFQGNVLSQKLQNDLGLNKTVSDEGEKLKITVVTDENGKVTVGDGAKTSAPGSVSQQDVRRALAGDQAALDRISTAIKTGTPNSTANLVDKTGNGNETGDNASGKGSNITTANGASGTNDATALANLPTDEGTQAILDQVNRFAAKGVKGFDGAEIVGGKVTLTDGRTVTGDESGGLQVSGASNGAASFGITGNAVSALEGNNPIVSKYETNRLVKGIDAGLNLSGADNTNTNLDFNANAASTKTGVVGDRNNSVQLTFTGGTPDADGRGLTANPGGVNQLSIEGIEKAADNKLGRKDRNALGLSEDRPKERGLGVQNTTGFLKGIGEARVNGRSALDAAFGGAGISADNRSAQQGDTDLSNLGDAVDIFGSLKNRSQKLGDPTEQLRDNALKQAVSGVFDSLNGQTSLENAQKQLNKLGLGANTSILIDNNDGTFSVSKRAIKKALDSQIGITRTDAATTGQTGGSAGTTTENTTENKTNQTPVAKAGGANTTQDIQAVLQSDNEELKKVTKATGNVLGSLTLRTDQVAPAQGQTEARGNTRVVSGKDAGQEIGGDASNPINSTESNIRQETARRLSQSTSQGGLGIGKIDAKSLVFNDKGELTGISKNGQTQSLDEFAASNAKLSSANAARRNRILGLTGKNAESGLSTDGIKSVAGSVVGDVRSESNSGLNNALSGASDAARSTLAALKGGNDEALKNVSQTVNADGSISLKKGNENFLITKDGELQKADENGKAIGAAFANQILGQAAGVDVNKNFDKRKKAIEDLTKDINESFQVNFGLFKVGEKVSNINVDFDAQGNITGAGVKLNDGSTFNLANDPSSGSLRAINAKGPKGAPINRSVNGGINYFNQQSRTGGFESESRPNGLKSILEELGADVVSIDERDRDSSVLKKDDKNSFNNNFTQEGRLRFNLNEQYFDVGYAVDKNGGLSLNLDGATPAQKDAIQKALAGSSGINARANTVIADLEKDADFQAILKTNDPNKIRNFISNKLQGSNLNTQISNNLAEAITSSNVTISPGQTVARALKDSGLTSVEANTITQALDKSELVKKALADPNGADSANVINKALEQSGISDPSKRDALTAQLLKPTTFEAKAFNTGDKGVDATTQFARLFGAGNRGQDALRDISGGVSRNRNPAQEQNARTQYNNTVAAEGAIIKSIETTAGAGNAKFLTVGLQALLGDEKASALVATDDKKRDQIVLLKRGIVGLDKGQAQERLNVFLRSEGLEKNSIGIDEIATFEGDKVTKLKDLSAVDIRGRVNVEGSYDGRAQITGTDIQYGPKAQNTIPSLSVKQDASGKYTVNVGGAPPTGSGPTVGAANTDIQESLKKRYSNPEDNQTGLQKFGKDLGSFLDGTTRFLGETLDAIMPGIQAYKKAMEDLEEARVRLKAATDQLNAARKYAQEMGVTFGNTNIDGGGEGGTAAVGGTAGASGAAGGGTPAVGGVSAAGNAQSTGGTNNNGTNNNGTNGVNGAQGAGNSTGTSNTDAADDAASTEAEQAESAELLNTVTSDSNFANIAVLIGLSPGLLIEQAQQMDMLEQLSETIQQLQSPFSNPVQSMREFVKRLEMAQSGAQLPQDGIVL